MTSSEQGRNPLEQSFEGDFITELGLTSQEKFAFDLSSRIAEAVKPVFGIKQRDVPVSDRSHDFNYAIDEVAEGAIKKMFESYWKRAKAMGVLPSAYITEDQGLVDPGGELDYIYMIDPVDGSRPAMSGTEQACVTLVAVKGDKKEATFSDIEFGVTHFIKEGITLFVRRGQGVWLCNSDGSKKIQPPANPPIDLKDCSTTTESFSFDRMFTGIVYNPLLRAAGYEISAPSGSWSVASLVRGHNELAVDIRNRLDLEYPGHPIIKYDPVKSKGGYPMDIAASALMVQELGGVVTDAYGNALDNKRLWEFDQDGNWDSSNQLSIVAAITPELHKQAMEKINEGFDNLRRM